MVKQLWPLKQPSLFPSGQGVVVMHLLAASSGVSPQYFSGTGVGFPDKPRTPNQVCGGGLGAGVVDVLPLPKLNEPMLSCALIGAEAVH